MFPVIVAGSCLLFWGFLHRVIVVNKQAVFFFLLGSWKLGIQSKGAPHRLSPSTLNVHICVAK